MKVLDLRCAHGHGFEGWFASDDDFMDQNGRGLVECPLCADKVRHAPAEAPRLNLSGARAPLERWRRRRRHRRRRRPADLQAAWLQAVRHLLAHTEDVGERFAEEARRIHYGEEPQRGIRGQATPEERRGAARRGHRGDVAAAAARR